MRIEIVADLKSQHGEGPVWDVQTSRLYWVDGTGQRIHRCTVDGQELRTWEAPERVGSMALRSGGGAVVALRTGIHFFDFESEAWTLVADPEPQRQGNCLNDGKVDRRGRFVVGSMDLAEVAPTGALYSLDPSGALQTLEDGVICSNGPCWSPDGRTLYFHDSFAGAIWAYDYDLETGGASNRRVFATPDTAAGAADGSTVDAEGFLWNAQIFDGLIVRYAPDGSVDRSIQMPVKKVTSVAFGGPNLDILFVTSMGKRVQHIPDDGLRRGGLFAVYGLDVRGLPERRFDG